MPTPDQHDDLRSFLEEQFSEIHRRLDRIESMTKLTVEKVPERLLQRLEDAAGRTEQSVRREIVQRLQLSLICYPTYHEVAMARIKAIVDGAELPPTGEEAAGTEDEPDRV